MFFQIQQQVPNTCGVWNLTLIEKLSNDTDTNHTLQILRTIVNLKEWITRRHRQTTIRHAFEIGDNGIGIAGAQLISDSGFVLEELVVAWRRGKTAEFFTIVLADEKATHGRVRNKSYYVVDRHTTGVRPGLTSAARILEEIKAIISVDPDGRGERVLAMEILRAATNTCQALCGTCT